MATRELDAAPIAAPSDEQDRLTRTDRANLFRYMVMMRASEERALTLYRQGKVPGSFYDGRGQEAISVGSAFVLVAERSDVHPASRPRRALRARRHP